MMRKGARIVATELLREPVKQAVREALHEETSSVTSTGGIEASTSSAGESTASRSGGEQSDQRSAQQSDESSSDSGGRSKLGMVGLVLAIAGITYLARRRMSSTSGSAWSEPSPGGVASDDAESGYVSEGEMQTAETADESSTGSEGASQSTAADQ